MIHPGIIGKIILSAAGVSAIGMKAARYWRLGNIIRHSSNTQIYGFAFHGSGFGSTSKLAPVTITNDAGDMTAEFNHSKVGGDSGAGPHIIDAYTFFDFDFGVPVTPDRLEIWGKKWNVEYIASFDISWSDNNTAWNKVGEFHAETQIGILHFSDHAVFCRHIWSEGGIQFSNASISVIHGRTADGVFLNRPTTTVILGRAGEGVLLNRPAVTTILGRAGEGVLLNRPVITIIDKPI